MITITQVTIHHETDNACFGDSAVQVQLDDEAGGYFVVLNPLNEEGKVKLDFNEIPELVQAVEMLKNQKAVEEWK
jgi:hypothetical protein